MTRNEFFEILGDIDESKIAEATKSKRFIWIKWASAAACFLIVAAASIPMINNIATSKPEISDFMAYTQTAKQSQQQIHLPMQPYRGQEIAEDVPADVSGTPVIEAVNANNLSADAAAVFGGSYIENGKFVVVLTQDTPENRSLICRELNRNETTVTFKTGRYTLLYLTELQSKISSEMTNKQLPTVTSSALMETSNRIEVRVTSDNNETVEKLNALDTIGGAIEIKEICSYPTKDVMRAE